MVWDYLASGRLGGLGTHLLWAMRGYSPGNQKRTMIIDLNCLFRIVTWGNGNCSKALEIGGKKQKRWHIDSTYSSSEMGTNNPELCMHMWGFELEWPPQAQIFGSWVIRKWH